MAEVQRSLFGQVEQPTCQHCGKPTKLFVKSGKPKKWCSPKCQRASFVARHVHSCEVCQRAFTSRDAKTRFCSHACRAKAVNGSRRLYFDCQHCGKRFWSRTRENTYCSRDCAFASHRVLRRQRKEQRQEEEARKKLARNTRECVLCGVSFLSSHPNARYCGSSECRARLWRDRGNRRYHEILRPQRVTYTLRECVSCCQPFIALGKRITCSPACRNRHAHQQRLAGLHRRAARLAGNPFEPYRRIDIFKRDGWTCQLCHKPIDREALCPHPLSVTIDHVVAVAKGGADAPYNVQTAHFLCNSLKGDREAAVHNMPPTG